MMVTGEISARGSPSMVNGVGLRLPSLRGSRVRIPPPALHVEFKVLSMANLVPDRSSDHPNPYHYASWSHYHVPMSWMD